MVETHEFRIFNDYFPLLSVPNKAIFNGAVYVIHVTKGEPIFDEINNLNNYVKEKNKKHFFGFWDVKRSYTKKEWAEAKLFHLHIKTAFEPTGDECGTVYDETVACEICGANRKQIGPLKLKKGSIPKKDIARTIAGEVVVSEKFVEAFKRHGMRGELLKQVVFNKGASGHYQLLASTEIELSENTLAGENIFDLSSNGSEAKEVVIPGGYKIKFEKEVYKCPRGHTIGLNLISEPYIVGSPVINDYDFFSSKQKLGVKRGLLRPEPLYFCSQEFRKMVIDEKLTGFYFEVAHIEGV